MTSFIEDESSDETSQPREGIELILTSPTPPYRIATGDRDITIAGQKYTALPSSRGEAAISSFGDTGALVVQLPVSHPFVLRYIASPPRRVQVNVYRLQVNSGDFETLWRGEIASMEVNEQIAAFQVPSRISLAMSRRLPTVSVSKLCPHVLYGPACRADRPSFTVDATIAWMDGRQVRLDVAMDEQWARGGELVHVPSGEPILVFDQTSFNDLAGPHALLTLRNAIYGARIGDAVQVSAGCEHDVVTCRNKFNNVPNFGGFPQLPTRNPFLPNGLGIIEEP